MTVSIGKVGVWTGFMQWPTDPDLVGPAAAEVEALGYSALWVGTLPGSGPVHLALAESTLGATERLAVATGILDVWTNPPSVVAETHARLQKLHGGRFLLGLGASHAPFVEPITGGTYERPLERIAGFLDELDTAQPAVPVAERVIGALGPRALALSARRTAGAHPYLVTPEHTATARRVLGDGPLLAPEQKIVITTDAAEARRVGRRLIAVYLSLPNYLANLRRMGFDDVDFADGGSDRLVDGLVAWGDLDTVRRRVQQHFDAGADHVALQVLTTGDRRDLPFDAWREAAPLATAFDG
jgi:probable F420-dependent oxidoreductase